MTKMTFQTGNGAPAYEHSLNHHLEFFSKGGSIRGKATYYDNIKTDPVQLFKDAWYTGQYKMSMQLLFWARDCRGGAGNRQIFRDCIKWLANTDPNWVRANIHLIPHYGRWDDLVSLYNTPCEDDALKLWSDALLSRDNPQTPLAAKWADRQDIKLRQYMKMHPKAFRKLVVEKTKWIVERNMCSNEWDDINFSSVPSVAGMRYRKAFIRHDGERYNKWCLDLAQTKDVNASVLFPHDIIRMVHSTHDTDKGFETLVETAFKNIPNYITNPNVKIMPICDFSGSMTVEVAGSISALDISLGLGLYCSDRLGRNNPFWRKLIPFSSNAKLEYWGNTSVLDAIRNIPDGYAGSTNIESALNLLLDSAVMWNVKPEDMVTTLLIISDMQWDCSVRGGDAIEACMSKWVKKGYKKPSIIHWNTVAYKGQPASKNTDNVALISGFSPSILKDVLGEGKLDPVKIMLKTIEKYDIITP